MPVLEFTITAKLDGKVLEQFGFPVRRRIVVDEIQAMGPYTKADDGEGTTFTSAPIEQIATVQALMLSPSAAITVRLDGQSNAGIVLGINSLLLIIGATIDASATTNATINANGATSDISGFAAGT